MEALFDSPEGGVTAARTPVPPTATGWTAALARWGIVTYGPRRARRLLWLALGIAALGAAGGCRGGRHHAHYGEGPPPARTSPDDDVMLPPPRIKRSEPAPEPSSPDPPPAAPPPPHRATRPSVDVTEPGAPPARCGPRRRGQTYAVHDVDASDVLNVRMKPDFHSAVNGTLAPDTTGVQVVGAPRGPKGASWRQVSCGHIRGWVRDKFLVPETE